MEITDKKRTVDDSGTMCYNHYVSLQNYHERIERVMPMTVNIARQVRQIRLSTAKALWPLFETVINSIQSLEDTSIDEKKIVIEALRSEDIQLKTDGSGGTVVNRFGNLDLHTNQRPMGYFQPMGRWFCIGCAQAPAAMGASSSDFAMCSQPGLNSRTARRFSSSAPR